MYISLDMRGHGIGKTLFLAAKEWAKKKEQKNYISLPIPLWKVKPFIKLWDVKRPRYMIKSI